MSRTHFLRKNGVSTKYFSAFWEKFSLWKIALPQPDRCSWNKSVICPSLTILLRGKKDASLTAVVQREGPGSAFCYPLCFQDQLSISLLHHQWVSKHAPCSTARTPCWRPSCPHCPFIFLLISEKTAAEEKKKKIRWATFMILHPVIKDSWTINGTYTPVQCTGWSRCTLSCQLYI